MKLLLILILLPQIGFAAGGFEKPSLWAPDSLAIGEAVESSIDGAHSLYFNPAGLNKNQIYFSSNLLTGTTKSTKYINNKSIESSSEFVFTGSLFSSFKLNKKTTLGLGIYSVGGVDTQFESLSFDKISPDFSNLSPDLFTQLQVVEFSLGGSYHFNKNLSLGLALRGQKVDASFQENTVLYSQGLGGMGVPDGTPISLSSTKLDNLSQIKLGSFASGIQYQTDLWGVALNYRSKVKFSLDGDASGNVIYTDEGATLINMQTGGASSPSSNKVYQIKQKDANVSSQLPEKISASAHYKISNLTLYLGYSLTKYSNNKEININSTLVEPNTNEEIKVDNTPLYWKDLHDYKLGVSYKLNSTMIIKGGYVLSSQVTNNNYSSPTLAAPSKHHHYSAGISKKINNFTLDIAGEYFRASGEGKTKDYESSENLKMPSVTSNYKSKVYGLYFGGKYNF